MNVPTILIELEMADEDKLRLTPGLRQERANNCTVSGGCKKGNKVQSVLDTDVLPKYSDIH